MEDKSIRFNFVKGEIKDVWLRAELDQTYRRLFENAYKSAKKYPKNVAHGIKIIVFGCFWLESYANELLKIILYLEISSKKLQKEVWTKLKRISIEEKLDFFSKLLTSELQKEYQNLKIPFKQLNDLRGCLAHYKDEPERLVVSIISDNSFIKTLENIPQHERHELNKVPEMNKQLMWSKVKLHAETIKKVSKWFRGISKYYHQCKGIIIT